MTIGEALGQGLETTVIGLSTIFAVLIILMIVIQIMKVIFYKDPSKEKKTENIVKTEVAEEVIKEEMSEEELVAILSAAVAASLNTSTYNLRIKSYRRVDNNTPAWNRAGIRDTMESRF